VETITMAVNAQIRLKVFSRDKYRCVECGKSAHLTIDHILPISKGGTDELNNLQTMCDGCNQRKANITLTWKEKLFPFIKKHDLEKHHTDLLGAISSKNETTRINLITYIDTRLNDVKPKVEEYLIKMMASADLQYVGVKNSVEAYGKRSQERDDQLLKVINLLCDKVEQLEKQLHEKDNSNW
jgi:5-methylcytosine-specific restriction protein A